MVEDQKWIAKQAKADLEDAKRALERAKESKSKSLIDEAQEAYDKAKKQYAAITSDNERKAATASDRWMSEQYRALGPMVAQLVKEDPELERLFRQAVSEEWDADRFKYELENNTDWWQSKSAPWRQAFALENASGRAEWNRQLKLGSDAVKAMAAEYGVTLSEAQASKLARRYHYQGWAQDEAAMQSFFAGKAAKAPETGEPVYSSVTQLADELSAYAKDFGISYDPSWLKTTALKLMDPKSGVKMNAVLQQMAAAAESRYPSFKGKLGYATGDGQSVTTLRDAASDYVGLASQLLEVQARDIDLSDGLFRKAFNAGEGEEPKMMSLYDFENEVRNDPRWAKTKNAEDAAYANVNKVLEMFGMTG